MSVAQRLYCLDADCATHADYHPMEPALRAGLLFGWYPRRVRTQAHRALRLRVLWPAEVRGWRFSRALGRLDYQNSEHERLLKLIDALSPLALPDDFARMLESAGFERATHCPHRAGACVGCDAVEDDVERVLRRLPGAKWSSAPVPLCAQCRRVYFGHWRNPRHPAPAARELQ